MIDWVTIKPTIAGQIAELASLGSDRVRWADEPSGLVNGIFPVIWLRAASVAAVGIDEERYDQNANKDDQGVTVCGQRRFTLSIRVESFTSDIADPLFAGNILENIKTRTLRSTSKFARINAFGVADYGPTRWFSYIEAGRPVNVYVADMFCVTVNNDTDTTQAAGNYVNEVIGSGTTDVGNVSYDIKGPG